MILDLSPEQNEYRDRIRAFARGTVVPQAAAIDQATASRVISSGRQPGRAWRASRWRRSGAGRGATGVSYALAVEELAYASVTLAVVLVVSTRCWQSRSPASGRRT